MALGYEYSRTELTTIIEKEPFWEAHFKAQREKANKPSKKGQDRVEIEEDEDEDDE